MSIQKYLSLITLSIFQFINSYSQSIEELSPLEQRIIIARQNDDYKSSELYSVLYIDSVVNIANYVNCTNYLNVLSNLAICKCYNGYYTESIDNAKLLLSFLNDCHKETEYLKLSAYSSLISSYESLGERDSASFFVDKVLKIKATEENMLSYSGALSAIFPLFLKPLTLKTAEKILKKSKQLSLIEKQKGFLEFYIYDKLSTANIYRIKNNRQKAIQSIEEAYHECINNNRSKGELLIILLNKANIEGFFGLKQEHEKTLNEALSIFEKDDNTKSMMGGKAYSWFLSESSSLNENNSIQEMIDLYCQSFRNRIESINNIFPTLSPEHQEAYIYTELTQITNPAHLCFSFPNNKDLSGTTFDYCLKLKGCLTNSSQKKEKLSQTFKTTWKDVANKLSGKDIAIEFMTFDNDQKCAAIVINKYWDAPKFVYIGNDNDISLLLKRYVEGDNNALIDFGEFFWRKIIIIAELTERSNIFFCPSGFSIHFCIEDMPLRDGYLYDIFNVYRVSSTRELLNIKSSFSLNNSVSSINKVALFGGIKYGRYNSKDKQASYYDGSLSSVDPATNTDVYRSGFDFLPYTKIELDTLSSLFSQNGISIEVFEGENGSKKNFLSISGKENNIIHIATHGMFIQREYPDSTSANYQENLIKYSKEKISDRLMRSFLVMSDANVHQQNNIDLASNTKSFLTAYDISKLDLRDVEIATVSTCMSGLGDVTFDDGNAGMEMAFKRAGVKTIIMSLSQVDDKVCYVFMKHFYNNIINGYNKYRAFVKAKNTAYENTGTFPMFIMVDGFY